MGVAGLLLPFPRPRSPYGCLLLRHADQHHKVFAFARRRFQIGTSCFLFVLALLEVHDRNMVSFRKPVDRLHVFIADSAKRGRGRNRELPLPAQERAYVPDGLKPGYVGLQENAIDGTAPEGHVIPE